MDSISKANKIAAQWAAILIKDGYHHMFTVLKPIVMSKYKHTKNGNIATITYDGTEVVMKVNGHVKIKV